MVGAAIALSLLGLGAVHALPAQPIEERQSFIIGPPSGGGGSVDFGSGVPKCSPEIPSGVPCISEPINGGFKIPKEKRDEIKERQTFVIGPPASGGGSGVGFGGGIPKCSPTTPSGVPCISEPISGGFKIPKEKRADDVLESRQELITIGRDVCTQTEIVALMYAFTQIVLPYGSPSKAPPYIQSIARDIIESLKLCGMNVGGWTTLTPGGTIPGGPLVPQPTVPGGPITPNPTVPGGPLRPEPVNPGGSIKPDPVQPGGPITPDPTVPGGILKPPRSVETLSKDAAALLASLRELEKAFGSYGSPNIPKNVYTLMVEHVLALQKIPGVVVAGWPVLKQELGGGSVTLRPSP